MNLKKISKIITFAALCMSSIISANAVETETKREIYNANKGSVYGVKGTLKITATLQGQVKNQEGKIWSNATCISDGLFVAAYASISPNVGGNMPDVQISKEISTLQIISSTGEAFDAKLVLHDEDLGLAYIAINPKAENIANWKNQIVDISNDPELKHLDETINISRFASHSNYQSVVTLGHVSAIIEKPRKLYQIINASLSGPSFNDAGEFIGITVAQAAEKGKPSPPVTIPAKYIRKLLEQAKTLQSGLDK